MSVNFISKFAHPCRLFHLLGNPCLDDLSRNPVFFHKPCYFSIPNARLWNVAVRRRYSNSEDDCLVPLTFSYYRLNDRYILSSIYRIAKYSDGEKFKINLLIINRNKR